MAGRAARVAVMPSFADRSLVFLDVDGPLIPFAARPSRRPAQGLRYAPAAERLTLGANPLLDRLNPDDGRRLLALGCELVWATTWMADANEVISPRIGLPELPVVDWPDADYEPVGRLHWKTQGLVSWAAGRSFVWIDDEITDADRHWVPAHHPSRALLHRVDPRIGLRDADFVHIRRWLAEG